MTVLPTIPFVEQDENALLAHLKAEGASEDMRRVALDLHRDGLATIDLVNDETLALCDQATAELEPAYLKPGKINRVQDAWRRSPAVRRLATDKRITDFLRLAYGREPFAFQTLNFLFGSQQGAHSDVTHFHAEPARFMCGVWLALEDVYEDAGALLYYPGSHKLPLMTPPNMGITKDAPTKQDYNEKGGQTLHALVAEHGLELAVGLPKKGQAMIWAANLFHGGTKRTHPDRTRRSLVTHFFFKGCLYHTPMTSGTTINRHSVRLPADISTGQWQWPSRDGRPVMPQWRTLAAAMNYRLQRNPICFP